MTRQNGSDTWQYIMYKYNGNNSQCNTSTTQHLHPTTSKMPILHPQPNAGFEAQ
jgi:hypothetical protein